MLSIDQSDNYPVDCLVASCRHCIVHAGSLLLLLSGACFVLWKRTCTHNGPDVPIQGRCDALAHPAGMHTCCSTGRYQENLADAFVPGGARVALQSSRCARRRRVYSRAKLYSWDLGPYLDMYTHSCFVMRDS